MATNSQFTIAIHVLAMLAKNCDGRIKSEYIAESVNTNAVVIRRLLCQLSEAKLVVSQVGACGGTCLAKSAVNISLLEVYQAVSHAEVFSLHRQTPNQNCPIGKNIQAVLGKIQDEIDEVIERKLAQYTLQDVIESVELEKVREQISV